MTVEGRSGVSGRSVSASRMASEESLRVRDLADRYWADFLSLEPLVATQVGEERFDHLLPDRTPAGLARREAVNRAVLIEIDQIDRRDLDRESRLTLDVIETLAKREQTAIEHRFDRLDAADHMWGPGTMLAQIASVQLADSPERLGRYLTRLAAMPNFLATSGELLREAAGAGQTSPRLVVDRTIAQVERLLRLPPAHSPAVSLVPESDLQGRNQVEEVLRDHVYPAYEDYVRELRGYRATARTSIGLVALRNGEEMYAARILAWTTLPLDAGEIHRRGADQLARIQQERLDLAARVGAPDPETAIARLLEGGGNTFASREAIVALAEDQVERGWEAAHGFFGRLPRENCRVKAVDRSREDDVLEHYLPGTADGSRRATYFVNTKDPGRRHRHSLATTTYHEANPGHHLQIAIEQEASDRTAIRRFGGADSIGVGSAFVEGWGLYAERLADEMGLYENDYERMGMLEMQAFRAARLVVDTGIHAFGWTREQAVDTMASTGTERAKCELEVDRYVAMPGQALCYTLGQLVIEECRNQASGRMGGAFSLSTFHDRLLSLGSLPLPLLEREMRSFGA
jgi:uncharacterized protein (DUF885 family)